MSPIFTVISHIFLVPLDSVRNLTVISVLGSDSILNVSWFPPTTPNGVIINYEVNVSTLTSTIRVRNFSVSSTLRADTIISRSITNLGLCLILIMTSNTTDLILTAPKVPYYVKVAAYTVKGRGPYSDEVVNFTKEGGKNCMSLHVTAPCVIVNLNPQFHYKVLRLLTSLD